MKLLLLSLLFCNIAYSQWSPVTTFDSVSPIDFIIDFDFISEQQGFLISYGNNTNTFFRTTDGGITWDSTTSVEGYFSSIVMATDSIIYVAGNLNMSPFAQNYNESKQLYRSLDAGQTWSQNEIFNTWGLLQKDCMAFTNDSTGFVSCNEGMYFTNNYGNNWSFLNDSSGRFAVNLGSEVATFYNNDVYLTDVNSLSVQTNYLDCSGMGEVKHASSYGDTLIRNNYIDNGWGSSFNALTISELGGNTNVFLFLDNYLSEVAINPSGIYAINQRPLRSIDGGQSFFKQDCTLPSDSILSFTQLDFIDNNIAYAIARNSSGSLFKLLKTTNAGGITTNYITQPLQNVGLTNDADEPSLQVYPNPAINELNIESSSLIDQLEVYDLTGRSLAKYTGIQSTHFEVDCRFLHSGNYLVKVSSEGKTAVRQVRVE
jgi:photosystem II stability/assembly factor-like uncharacterized protein